MGFRRPAHGPPSPLAIERRARIAAEARADEAERTLAEREAQLADLNAQLHHAANVVDDLVRTRVREGREADERLAVLAGALAEAERASAARPRPPRTVIVVEGDVVEVRETA